MQKELKLQFQELKIFYKSLYISYLFLTQL